MKILTGIEPLDARLGGLRAGGVYLMAGTPGAGKLAALLQFLHTGLAGDERVALLSSQPPATLLAEARHWGWDLQPAWREDRLRCIGYRGDFAANVLHAGEAGEALDELGRLLGDRVTRLALDPATPLWETRADPSAGQQFLEWTARRSMTVWSTLPRGLSEAAPPAAEWVMRGAAGVFELERLPSGLRQLWVRRFAPPVDLAGPLTLSLEPGRGFVAPNGQPSRRRTDTPDVDPRRLLLVRLADVPAEVAAWARGRFDVVEATDPLAAVPLLRDDPSVGVVLVYLDRAAVDRGVLVCRAARPLTGSPIVLASDQPLRAGDRARALDAGADDFVSGSVSLAELESRIARAASVVRDRTRPNRTPPRAVTVAGPAVALTAAEFAARVRGRADDRSIGIFSLIQLPPPDGCDARIRAAVLGQIRAEAGDFAGTLGDGFGVYLEDARPGQAQAFLTRLHGALGRNGHRPGRPALAVLSSPADGVRIRALVEV